MTDWIETWPAEPGRYLFYGHACGLRRPDLYLVDVGRAGVGLLFISGGLFLYKSECRGYWKLFDAGELPDLEKLEP